MLLKNKKVTNRRTINTKKINMQAISIKYELISLNKLKKVTNAPANIINFLNMHLNRIKNNNDNNKDICKEMNNTRPVVICDNIKNTNKKLINKVHIENNSANTITKKTHIKVFNNVSKKVKSINNTHADYDKYKKTV